MARKKTGKKTGKRTTKKAAVKRPPQGGKTQSPRIRGHGAARKAGRGSSRKSRTDDTRELIIIPVRNMVLFPGVVLPLMVGRERSVEAIEAATENHEHLGLLLQLDEQQEAPGPHELHKVGTVADIVRYWTAQDGRHQAICQGLQRFRILEYTQTEPYLVARVQLIEQAEPRSRAVEARFVALKQRAQEVLALSPGAPEDLAQAVQAIDSPSMLADMVATFMDVPAVEKQEVLEIFELKARLDRLNEVLGELSEVLKLSHKIRQDTKGALDDAQREYYLREQLHAIQRELGEGDEKAEEIGELGHRIDQLGLSPDVAREARKELRRLDRMPEQAAEYSMLRTYLEVFTELPWNTETADKLDLNRAQRILDEDHYGLDKVKQRILEFLAVRKLNPEGRGPTLCLVGPPGVGKTSLGRSIARAMGRNFVRVSLGGIHDEAEIRGHRRTYIGSMPGRILTGLRKAGSKNPVFMLDEMDKLGRGMHGDPSSALLEVLDPAQNDSFTDSYLGVPFNLRHTLFVATANVLEGVPGPLRDRLEVIHIPGYTEEEKLQIGRRYLVKRQLEACGLKASQCRIDVASLREIIRNYTREAGVRNLEREINAVCRSVATRFAKRRRKPVRVTPAEIAKILGPVRYEREAAMRTAMPGVATGLAWTPVGGEILFIETTRMPGKGALILTGQLGDVMKESARAALSLARSRGERLGLPTDFFDGHDLHMHIPAGAVPKDGPSAGVAMFTSLISLGTRRCIKKNVAMTGEISLRGLVLPVGGIKEKVLAALAAGIKTVLLPRRNERDLEEIRGEARGKLEFVFLDTVDDAVQAALHR